MLQIIALLSLIALMSATDFFAKTVMFIVRKFRINEFLLIHFVIPTSLALPIIFLSIFNLVFRTTFVNTYFLLPLVIVPFVVRYLKLGKEDIFFLIPFLLAFSKLTLLIALGIFSYFIFVEAKKKKHFVYLRQLKINYILFPLSIFTIIICSFLVAAIKFNSYLISIILFLAALEVLISAVRENEKRLKAFLATSVYSLIFPALFGSVIRIYDLLIGIALLSSFFFPIPKRVRYGISILALALMFLI